MNDPLVEGIGCVLTGDLMQARALLAEAVQANPDSARSWLWLGRAMEQEDKKRYCFEQALLLEPGLIEAVDELENMEPAVRQAAALPVPSHEAVKPPPPALGLLHLPPEQPAPTLLSQLAPPKETFTAHPVRESAHVAHDARSAPAPRKEPNERADHWLATLVGIIAGLLLLGVPSVMLIRAGAIDGDIRSRLPSIPTAVLPGSLAATLSPASPQPPPAQVPALVPALAAFSPTPTYVNSRPEKNTGTPLPGSAGSATPPAALLSTQAHALMAQARYEAAIPLWDRVIAANPTAGEAYAQRGLAYYQMSASLRTLPEYQDYLRQAIADLDSAIRIGPAHADDYDNRALAYWDLANVTLYRADRQQLYALSLDNLQIAVALGASRQSAESDLPALLNSLGKCSQALEMTEHMHSLGSPALSDDRYYDLVSSSSLCLGKMDQAQQANDQARQIREDVARMTSQALILWNQGKTDLAFDVIDTSIRSSPAFAGDRYYLRALIEYDQGNKDGAAQDLAQGFANSWDHAGLYDYVMGKLVLDTGDRQVGIDLLREAEASLRLSLGPELMSRVHRDLISLGGIPLVPTPNATQAALQPTAFPPEFLAQITPQPTPTRTQVPPTPGSRTNSSTGGEQPTQTNTPAPTPTPTEGMAPLGPAG